jgi:type I restriction enzyme, R subunit
VDYIGIANELKSALKEYTASQGRGRPTVDAAEAFAVLAEKLDALRGMLHGHDYRNFATGGHRAGRRGGLRAGHSRTARSASPTWRSR